MHGNGDRRGIQVDSKEGVKNCTRSAPFFFTACCIELIGIPVHLQKDAPAICKL